jgi:hypothetical protein
MYSFFFVLSEVTDKEGEHFETFLVSLELLSYRGFDVNMERLDFWKPRVYENSEV